VILERPAFVSATTNLKAVRTKDVYDSAANVKLLLQKEGCVYFYENKHCFSNLERGATEMDKDSSGRCKQMHQNFDLKDEFVFDQFGKKYVLYSVNLKNGKT